MNDYLQKQSARYIHNRERKDKAIDYRLNKEIPQIMHIDLNSAFASAEQQAWPSLRGRPMGVTNRLSKKCCVIAASYEAKAIGIKVGKDLARQRHYVLILLCLKPTQLNIRTCILD